MAAALRAVVCVSLWTLCASQGACPAQEELDTLRRELEDARRELSRYRALEMRPDANLPWVNERKAKEDAEDAQGRGEDSDAVKRALLGDSGARFPEGHHLQPWAEHLDSTTPAPFQRANGTVESWPAGLDCRSADAVISGASLAPEAFSEETAAAAARLLDQCGFVYLDNFLDPEEVRRLRAAFERFKGSPEAKEFVYPVQGLGREEHMLPFQSPFNDSYIHDTRLIRILSRFLRGAFKMELQTVINSRPGSQHQRWHQGWRYLFHPEERLPPYAAVVTIPLVELSEEMGPTQICPGKKLRFYRGWSCPEGSVAASSTLGTMAIFDYKTLHRGPANTGPTDRPMVSLVYSRSFFLNGEAIVNRAIPMLQTVHQRRYWESYFWHPEAKDLQMMV